MAVAHPQFYEGRAVLTPTDADADELNDSMLEALCPSTEVISLSYDTAVSETELLEEYTPEFLHSIACSGLPRHSLRLRRGALVMLLRNYAPHKGWMSTSKLCVRV